MIEPRWSYAASGASGAKTQLSMNTRILENRRRWKAAQGSHGIAHAHIATLRDIVTLALRRGVPIIDSHTSLGHTSNSGSRRRTIEEMHWIARTGGVVCTWPVQVCLPDGSTCPRNSIEDWAGENLTIAREIGVEHIGLGTDGGGIGNLARLVEGFTSILDLPKLADAMRDVGFTRQEIAAYMGRNFLRMLAICVG